MRYYVLVADDADGTPLVLTGTAYDGAFRPIEQVRAGDHGPVLFEDRWAARRARRGRYRAIPARIIRHDRMGL